jgi:hypothetical protein
MEKKRQNLDNFFRENLSDFELLKKEGNWELLNHLLNEQERKKKNRLWLFLVFGFFILLISGLFILLPEKKSAENSKSNGQLYTPAPTENNSLENKPGKSTSSIPPVKNEIEKDVKKNAEHIKPENNSLVNDKANTSHAIAAKKKIVHPVVVSNPGAEHSVNIHTEINHAPQQSNISPGDIAKASSEQSTQPETPAAGQSQAGDSANASISAQPATNENLISPDSIRTKSVSNDSLITITKNDSLSDSAIAKPVPVKTNFPDFNFYVGVNIYSTSSAFTNKENISPIAGLEFSHPFSSKFSIGLGGFYSLQGGYHLNDTAKATQQTYFLDVSENISEQIIQIRQLYKLYFPLSLYYSVTNRHSLSGAIQLSYLLNTNGDYTEKNTTSGITNESQKNNVKGYMDGIKSTTIAVSLGYRYRLTKTFDVSTRITRELTETYIKEYFYGVNANPSWTFQTFLIVKF